MKIRIAASVALAFGLTLGMSGCSLFAHTGTTVQYAPSDGVEISANGVDLRNVMLVADETGENFNLVFGAVNTTGSPVQMTVALSAEGSEATAQVEVPAGNTLFGNPDGDVAPVVVSLAGVQAGGAVQTYFTLNGESDLQEQVPVLDATLVEYEAYVLPAGFGAEEDAAATEAGDAATNNADAADEATTEGN